jgi:hypothetical protein
MIHHEQGRERGEGVDNWEGNEGKKRERIKAREYWIACLPAP